MDVKLVVIDYQYPRVAFLQLERLREEQGGGRAPVPAPTNLLLQIIGLTGLLPVLVMSIG